VLKFFHSVPIKHDFCSLVLKCNENILLYCYCYKQVLNLNGYYYYSRRLVEGCSGCRNHC
jgi:hypothetical protein